MVGVPRSKGCSVCRNRRVKCDEARPECGQCRRYGCPCPGYNRGFKFQDEGPGLQRRHRRSSDRRTSDAGTKLLLDSASTAESSATSFIERRNTRASVPQVTAEEALLLMRSHAGNIDENLSPSLIQKLFLSQQPRLFMDFVCAAFPTLYFHNRFRSEVSYPEYIMENFNQRAHQDAAVCCLSAVYLASLTKDSRLLRASRHMYATALRKVNQALDTDEALSDIVLSTVMMLTIYEIYAQTTPDAWIKHARGVKQLFIRRGAKRHMSGFGRSCYYAYRGFLVAHALYEGIPCFLDSDEWQEFAAKVQEEDSKKPSEWAVFVNISEIIFMELVKCPRYIYEARRMSSGTPRHEQASLLARIRDSCAKLRRLSEELRGSVMYHFQKKQGIEVDPDGFVGPAPALFPDTNPTLLLQGATHCINTLEKLLRAAGIEDVYIKDAVAIGYSPEASSQTEEDYLSPTPSADSTCETISSGASPLTVDGSSSISSAPSAGATFQLPFRLVSEFNRGPSHQGKGGSHRPVVWLDRVACSMGMIGADIVEDHTDDAPDADLETIVEVVEE